MDDPKTVFNKKSLFGEKAERDRPGEAGRASCRQLANNGIVFLRKETTLKGA